MSYLAARQFVHRDLAARNVLVDTGYVYKVGDFGLSRAVGAPGDGAEYYRMASSGLVPVKWCSPEALRHSKFSSASDVWAFGVLLWEAAAWGKTPYPGLAAADLLAELESGRRLERPFAPGAHPLELYTEVMLPCWAAEPAERPSFTALLGTLKMTFARDD